MCSVVGLEALAACVAGVAGQDIQGRGAADLCDDLRRLRSAIDLLESEAVRRLARFDELGGPRTVGAPNAISFLQFQCGLDVGGAVQRTVLARTRELLPAVTEAAASGQISFDQAAIIARGAADVEADDAPEVERRALALALNGAEPRRLRHLTRGLVAEVDGERLKRDEDRAHRRRHLRIGEDRDGSVILEGLLESECAAYLRTVTDSLMGPADKTDDRTGPQRRHDALRDALRLLLAGQNGALPRAGGQRPHLVVITPLSTLLGEGGPPALLQGLVPISRETLLRLAAEGTLSATVVDANGREVYSGKSRRFSPAMRRTLTARTGMCGWAGGCDRPAEWCDGHHIDPYAEGGLTNPGNGDLLCGFHHNLVSQGWAQVLAPDGIRRALSPGDPDNPNTPIREFALASSSTQRDRAGPVA